MKTIMLAVLFSISIYSLAFGEDWRGSTNEYGDFYYDRDAVTFLPQGVVSVWVQHIHSPASVVRSKPFLGPKWASLHHSNSLYEINCKEKKARRMSVTFYSYDEKVLLSQLYSPDPWKFYPRMSVMEFLIGEMCWED